MIYSERFLTSQSMNDLLVVTKHLEKAMTQQLSLLDFIFSIGLGLACGCVLTCVFKLKASATTLFVLTLLAVCSTWIGINTDLIKVKDVICIHCNFFLQALFFAAAMLLAVRHLRRTRGANHQSQTQ